MTSLSRPLEMMLEKPTAPREALSRMQAVSAPDWLMSATGPVSTNCGQ